MKMHLKMSPVKWQPFCPGGDELIVLSRVHIRQQIESLFATQILLKITLLYSNSRAWDHYTILHIPWWMCCYNLFANFVSIYDLDQRRIFQSKLYLDYKWKIVNEMGSWSINAYLILCYLSHHWRCSVASINTFRLRWNRCHFADSSFKCIFLNENVWLSVKISLKCVQLTIFQHWFR